MKFLVLISLTITANLAAASTLAPDLPDGVYHSYTDEHGVELHTRLTHDDHAQLSWTHDPRSTTTTSNTTPAHPFLTSPIPSHKKRTDCSNDVTPSQVQCGCTFTVDPASCDSAVADIKAQIGNGITPTVGHAYYSIKGSVVAFQCAFANGDRPLTVQGFTDAAGVITSHCGRYVAGTYSPGRWVGFPIAVTPELLGYDVGYMRYTSGLDFCASARNSGQSCC